jgi:predicted RNA binding protein YcfA (HicA-like mRNA interferase family)
MVPKQYHLIMPRKIRQLIKDLEDAGFINRGGKGSHRNYLHEKGVALTISGKLGDDAKPYQEKLIRQKIKEVK